MLARLNLNYSTLYHTQGRTGNGVRKPFTTAYGSDIHQAFELVRECSNLTRCNHGGKVGVTIEPKAKNWPVRGGGDLDALVALATLLARAEERATVGTL